MASINHEHYVKICETLFSVFNRHELLYKVFGGIVVCLIDDARETTDIDMAIKKDMNEVRKLVDALVEIDYATEEHVLDCIFGADPHTEEFLYAFSRITSDNQRFREFHLDVCFEFGSTTYESIESVEREIHGVPVQTATLQHILKMKKAIDAPRERDKRDLQFLEELLGASEDSEFSESKLFP